MGAGHTQGRVRLVLALLLALAAALAALAAALAAPASGQQGETTGPEVERSPGSGAPYVSGELLVTLEEGASGLPEGLAGGLEVEERIPAIDGVVISVPQIDGRLAPGVAEGTIEELRRALEESPTIASADYNYLRRASYTPDDPGLGYQYGLDRIRAPQAWDTERGDAGARIAIVDTGVDARHPDLARKIVRQRDFVGGDSTADDSAGHGTHVAGIASAATDNGRGVAGACPDCSLMAAKVIGPYGGSDSDIAQGIVWSANNGADVVNLSLGGPGRSDALQRAVSYARDRGAVVVAAAGNSGDATVNYPAAYGGVLAVAATDREDRRASYSTIGRWVDLAAPGSGVVSTYPGGEYASLSGTSMAAPHVAGAAGLLDSRGLSAAGIERRLLRTADDLGPAGRDAYYGAGRIDADAAVGD